MDEKHFEMAAEFTGHIVDTQIARARDALHEKRPDDFDDCCVSCGAELDPRRVRLGFFTCVPCKEALERRHKLFS